METTGLLDRTAEKFTKALYKFGSKSPSPKIEKRRQKLLEAGLKKPHCIADECLGRGYQAPPEKLDEINENLKKVLKVIEQSEQSAKMK